MAKDKRSPIIVAHDKDTFSKDDELLYRSLRRYVGWIKIGLQAMTHETTTGVTTATRLRKWAIRHGFDVMWDMKLDDIPNTVENAARNIASLGSKLITLHASAGPRSLEAAARGVQASNQEAILLAVTVLTSIDETECMSVFGKKPGPKVVQFAKMAIGAGVKGLVCSPQELPLLANAGVMDQLLLVTPGVQPKWMRGNDQRRVMTPGDARRAGADMLVVGRAISQHPDPAEAAQLVYEESMAV